MRPQYFRFSTESGSTLVETLVAFGLLNLLLIGFLSVPELLSRRLRSTEFTAACHRIVRAKIRSLRESGLNTIKIQGGDRNYTWSDQDNQLQANEGALGRLSNELLHRWPTRDSSRNAELSREGFDAVKSIYNLHYPNICTGVTDLPILSERYLDHQGLGWVSPNFGMRSCAGSRDVWDEGAVSPVTGTLRSPQLGWTPDETRNGDLGPARCGSFQVDREILSTYPGFRLYVKLSRENSIWHWPEDVGGRIVDSHNAANIIASSQVGDGAKVRVLSNRCPSQMSTLASVGDGAGAYEFDGQGDAIRISVVGVYHPAVDELKFSEGLRKYICEESEVVSLPKRLIRYQWGYDRVVRESFGRRMGESAPPIFNFMTSSESSEGVLGVQVHPLNASVYVHRRGIVERYSDCSGLPMDCRRYNYRIPVTDSGRMTSSVDGKEIMRVDDGLRAVLVDWSVSLNPSTLQDRARIILVSGDGKSVMRVPFVPCREVDASTCPIVPAGLPEEDREIMEEPPWDTLATFMTMGREITGLVWAGNPGRLFFLDRTRTMSLDPTSSLTMFSVKEPSRPVDSWRGVLHVSP